MRLQDTARHAHVAAGAISGPGEYGGKGATIHGDLSGFPGDAEERKPIGWVHTGCHQRHGGQ